MKFKLLILITLFFFLFNKAAWAQKQAGASATLKNSIIKFSLPKKDLRIFKLENFFAFYDSPFGEKEIEAFLSAADQNQLDWRLLPAITGMESTFGQFLPKNSFNPFGWGIYDNKITRFKSYQEAIQTVAEGIGQKYPKEIPQIAYIYCPPNANLWTNQVTFYMDKIEKTPVNSQELLKISL